MCYGQTFGADCESLKSDPRHYTAELWFCFDLTVSTPWFFSSFGIRKYLFILIFFLQKPTVERLWSFRLVLETGYFRKA